MLTYILIGLWISSTSGSPIQQQNLKSPLLYYTPAASQYVQNNLYPFVQYQNPNESPAFGKALQSIQSPNEILFYPNQGVVPQHVQQPVFVNPQTGNQPTTRFTAPPSGLVDAIYAWFAENNVRLPDELIKNDGSQEQLSDQEKHETPDKTAGEAEILAEAEKTPNLHFPKKSFGPKFNPGQRFYILNGQPQFFGNYHPVAPRVQPVVPQLLTRSSIPSDQNIFILQQPDIQQQLKAQQQQQNQNVVLVQEHAQPEIKPVRYHSTDLKPQNYLLLRENQQENIQVPSYSRQQLLIGRYLPQNQDIKQQQIQAPIHQTHYLPIGVVPPQVPQFQTAQLYQNHQTQGLPQQEVQQPQLAFIHIPVDRNVQPPQYLQAKTGLQQPNSGKILYLSAEQTGQHVQHIDQQVPQQIHPENQLEQKSQQVDETGELAPGVAALEFARYIASRHGDMYSDSVVIDAKTDDENKEEDESTVQDDLSEEQSIAQAQPSGVALAGPGGVAATAPRGTALVGDRGLAVASPHATAVAGPNPEDKS